MVDRNLLRTILMEKLEIHSSKHFVSYDLRERSVIVKFKDGTISEGTLLVGADGANSRVRAALLNGFEATHSRAVMLNGSVELSKEQWDPILKHGTGGTLFGEPGLKGNFLLGAFLEDDRALINWCLAWTSSDVESDLKWTSTANGDQLFNWAKEISSHLPSYLVDAVNQTGPEGMQRPPIRLLETVLPHDTLPSGPVTLVGDAAHSMVSLHLISCNLKSRSAKLTLNRSLFEAWARTQL